MKSALNAILANRPVADAIFYGGLFLISLAVVYLVAFGWPL